MFSCNYCSKTFETVRSRNGHQRAHGGPDRYKIYSCLGCSKEFKDKTVLKRQYCTNACQRIHEWNNVTKPRIEIGKGGSREVLCKYVTERDGYACSACGIEDWQGKPLSLDLDHIDGDPANNFPSNLRFLCPNCHRQTDSWGNCAMKREKNNGRRKQNLDPRGTVG